MRRWFVTALFLAAGFAVIWAGGGRASAAVFGAAPAAPDLDNLAGAYCVHSGGIVENRYPVYGSNGSDPLRLSGSRAFCQYTASDGSRIHLLLTTLYTEKPSLAALAYYAAPALQSCSGNPASCYCSQLGGSDLFGGINAAGGGWYKRDSIDQTLEACVFPDESSIDSWGLAYHSAGIVRGIDLSTVLRYADPYAKQHRQK
jgi:putative hemolysin